jgi:hypothetical protein
LPWIIVCALLGVLGVAVWMLVIDQEPTRAASRDDATMRALLEESRQLEAQFVRAAELRAVNDEDLAILRRAIDNQRDWMRATGSGDTLQAQRLQHLENLLAEATARQQVVRSREAEAAAREFLAAGQEAAALEKFQEALNLQREINQGQLRGGDRDLPRETALAREIVNLRAAPVARELERLLAEARAAVDAQDWATALAAYRQARELQSRINREFVRTPFANTPRLEQIDGEIASLATGDQMTQLQQLARNAAEAEARGNFTRAGELYEQALAIQRDINANFPRSRFVSSERLEALEVARQSALSAELGARLAVLDAEVSHRLRAREATGAIERATEAIALVDEISSRFPRSRHLDAGLKLKLNFLTLQREALPQLLDALAPQFAPVPGHPGVSMLKTEVSQELYHRLTNSNPSRHPGRQHPVDSVNYGDVLEFCRRLSWVLARPVRLPTEAEFRAALGAFEPGALGEFAHANATASRAIGTGRPNAAGFFDLLGNVAEWLQTPDPASATAPVIGGAYNESLDSLAAVPRVLQPRGERARTVGFRVVVETPD